LASPHTAKRLNTTLVKIARSPLIDSGDLKETLKFILEHIASCLEVERVSVWRHTEERDQIVCIDMYEKSKGVHSQGLTLDPRDFPAYFECLDGEQIVAADDARTSRHTREFAQQYLVPNGITSMLDAPIRLSGNLIGILCHEHVGPARRWTLKEQYFAGVVAEMISRAFSSVEKEKVKCDLERVNSNLEKMNNRLAKINREKDELLMMVSHELKTPLHVIGGWAEMLVREELEPEQVSLAYETIVRNVEAQAHIIDDLLDTSRIILNRLILHKCDINLATIAQTAVSSARVIAEKKGVKVHLDVSDNDLFIHGDSGRIQQVLGNLLSNAIKYTGGGGEICVSLRKAKGRVEISVRDTGEGIEAALLPTIFERFSQGDSSVSRKHGGLGLGLAIAKHLVEAHGGSISATSDGRGCGTTFTIVLPELAVEAHPEPGHAFESGHLTEQPLKHLKLLVVEDDPDSRRLAELILREQGAEVETVENARDGLRELKKFKPDLLLCDLAMPGEDGFSLMQKIRLGAAPGFESIPAIAVSAFTDLASQNHALGSGFQEFVPKPLNQENFVNAILRVLRPTHA
jgi:signal transduction histidine kinase/CheY-like chemotaxis protein